MESKTAINGGIFSFPFLWQARYQCKNFRKVYVQLRLRY